LELPEEEEQEEEEDLGLEDFEERRRKKKRRWEKFTFGDLVLFSIHAHQTHGDFFPARLGVVVLVIGTQARGGGAPPAVRARGPAQRVEQDFQRFAVNHVFQNAVADDRAAEDITWGVRCRHRLRETEGGEKRGEAETASVKDASRCGGGERCRSFLGSKRTDPSDTMHYTPAGNRSLTSARLKAHTKKKRKKSFQICFQNGII
jgi:hypothetical protein